MKDVLIVGMGPTGAMLAALLGQAGVDALVVEKNTDVYPLPRAAHLDHEVLRLLHLVGADEPVLASSRQLEGYEFVTATGELLFGFYPDKGPAPTGFGWHNNFHQPIMEEALRASVAKLPSVTVELGVELVGYRDRGDHLVATVRSQRDDREWDVQARYMIGCDGASSPVRRMAGIGIDDLDFDEPWLVIDTLIDETLNPFPPVGLQHCNPERPVTSMPMGPGRHRWEFMLRPGETAEQVQQPEFIESLLAAQVDLELIHIQRHAVYRFHALFADRWRKGRVVLIGDAAHQMPPFMGQGLCSGVRDAANLAWKLTAVLRGEAEEYLLDTVQNEREPQIRTITSIAIDMGKTVCTMDQDAARQRDADFARIPLEQRQNGAEALPPTPHHGSRSEQAGLVLPEPWLAQNPERRLDDLVGYQPLMIVRDAAGLTWRSINRVDALPLCTLKANSNGDAIQLADAGGHLQALLGNAEAMLVMPDRIIFDTGTPAQLAAEWGEYLRSK